MPRNFLACSSVVGEKDTGEVANLTDVMGFFVTIGSCNSQDQATFGGALTDQHPGQNMSKKYKDELDKNTNISSAILSYIFSHSLSSHRPLPIFSPITLHALSKHRTSPPLYLPLSHPSIVSFTTPIWYPKPHHGYLAVLAS